MAGASEQTVRVEYLNANWSSRAGEGAGFELLVVTEDEARHALPISAADLAALGALVQNDPVLLFDPEEGTIIIANVLGQWLPPDWSSRSGRA